MSERVTPGGGDELRVARVAVQSMYRIYDVRVTKRSGETVALFRGRSSRLRPPTPNGVAT